MDMQIRDRFARQRAELANERTLLAYIRTSLGFVFVGVPAIWWLERLRVVSLRAEILCLALDIRRFMAVIVRDRNPDHQLWDMG